MKDLTYTSIGSVLHLNKAGELAQKRMKAAKVCDGLYITEPDKTQFVKFIVEYNGVKWVEHQTPAANINPANMAKRMPAILASIEGGRLNELTDYHKELHRRIFNPDTPAIMELKKPERKKAAPLPEGAKKVSVMMFKGCTDEITDKQVIITEVAPHVYTYTYKLKRYGERVKIIFEIDGVYFQGADNGAYVMAREDFSEVCAKAYEHARENVADGAAKDMRYFVEVQKRIDAATPPDATQTADTDAAIILPNEDINYMFYIKPKGEKRFSTYNPGKGTMGTGRVFTELYRKEHLLAVCKWIAEDKSGDYTYQLRSGNGKRIYWEHNPTAATPAETPQISTEAAETANVPTEDGNAMEANRMAAIIEPYKDIDKYALTPHYSELLDTVCLVFGISREDAREMYGLFTYRQWHDLLTSIISEPPQPPETPPTVNHATPQEKRAQTARGGAGRGCRRDGRIARMIPPSAWRGAAAPGYFKTPSKRVPAAVLFAPGYLPPIRGSCPPACQP